ncbi:hypothetical protein E3N88_40995 [Mikania micrantha]|uniref:Uncharacterized protein n=1 Tax=Mikania micrantha TaxID=192012 RepID=A0A5N6LRJ0_9ASTR|nr:hypothetical protein E3N88_40995 [Mikania micrantha]
MLESPPPLFVVASAAAAVVCPSQHRILTTKQAVTACSRAFPAVVATLLFWVLSAAAVGLGFWQYSCPPPPQVSSSRIRVIKNHIPSVPATMCKRKKEKECLPERSYKQLIRLEIVLKQDDLGRRDGGTTAPVMGEINERFALI